MFSYGRYYTVKLLLEGPEGHLIINAMDGEGMDQLELTCQMCMSKCINLSPLSSQ